MASERKEAIRPDCDIVGAGKLFFYPDDKALVAMLHSASLKAGFLTNGRAMLSPLSFRSPLPQGSGE